jgi:hypothetical protein
MPTQKPLWHQNPAIARVQIVLRLLTDLIALAVLAFRQRRATAAEILVLGRQIASLPRAGNQAAAH